MRNKIQTAPEHPRKLSTLDGLWPFLRPYRARVALAFVLLCLASTTILLVPLAFRDLIDFGFGKGVSLPDVARSTAGLFHSVMPAPPRTEAWEDSVRSE